MAVTVLSNDLQWHSRMLLPAHIDIEHVDLPSLVEREPKAPVQASLQSGHSSSGANLTSLQSVTQQQQHAGIVANIPY